MAERISIAVVGAGAIGGALAAALGDAGHVVTLCDRIPFEKLKRTLDGETRRQLIDLGDGLGVDMDALANDAEQFSSCGPRIV